MNAYRLFTAFPNPLYHRRSKQGFSPIKFTARPISNNFETPNTLSEKRKLRIEKQRAERVKKKSEKVGQVEEYPDWARVMEESAKEDPEVREILGDTVGDPEAMENRIRERLFAKGNEVFKPVTGSSVKTEISFNSFDPFDVNIWLELYEKPSEKAVSILGGVFRSWYILGNLGAYHGSRLQLTFSDPDKALEYSHEKNVESLPACVHNIADLEFQDNLGRVWVDLGTSDTLALDILINALINVNSDHVGIKRLVFGGKKFAEWEEGMTNEKDGYIKYQI